MPLRPLTIGGSATDAVGNALTASVSVTVDEPTIFGSSLTSSDSVDHYNEYDLLFGDIKISRTYATPNQDPNPYVRKWAAEDVAHDAASCISFKFLPVDVLSGAKDAILTTIFEGMPPGRTRWWTYWHEPSGEIYTTHDFTAADYRAAFAYVNALAQAHVRPGVDARSYLCIEEYSMRPANRFGPATPRPMSNVYPGDFIDAIGFDCYSGWSNNPGPYHISPAEQFDKLFQVGVDFHKPICFPEWGCGPTAPAGVNMTRAQWITSTLKYVKPHKNDIPFVMWWNSANSDVDASLVSDSASAAIWKSVCLNGWAGVT